MSSRDDVSSDPVEVTVIRGSWDESRDSPLNDSRPGRTFRFGRGLFSGEIFPLIPEGLYKCKGMEE